MRAGYLTLLGGYAVKPWLELMIAPDIHAGARSTHRDVGFVGVGGHLGAAFHLGDHIALIPECSTLLVVAGPSSAGMDSFSDGDVRLQCGLGFSGGSAYVSR